MKRVLTYLKPYKLPIIIAYSLTFLELAADLLLPFLLGKIINNGIKAENLNYVVTWGSIMIGIALVTLIIGLFNSFYASHTSNNFAYDLRKALFDKIQRFSFSNLSKYPTSALVTRFTNDVRQVQNTVFMALRVMVRAPLIVLGGVIMAFIVNARLALIFLITVPLLIVFIFWVLRHASRMFNRVQSYVDTVNRVMQENLANMRLIKAFVRRDHESTRFVQANRDLATMTRKAFRFVEASMPILLFIMNLSIIFILWFGNIQSVAGETEVGDVVAVVNYALRTSMAISMFTFITLAFSRAKASSERIATVLDEPIDMIDQKSSATKHQSISGNITFRDVSFAYPNMSNKTLTELSFTIKPEEHIAILGATGSGKTTMFQLIPRLYDTTEGDILFDGHSIKQFPLNTLREQIGYVPQTPLLFSGSIAENISWGKDNATLEEIVQAATDAQIHDMIETLPDKYDTRIGQRGVNLSGGQQQRLSIARALIKQPKILMFDDSTSALDLATESRLLKALDKYDCTVLMITQKISTALRADRILLLDNGKVLAFGTHKNLMASSTIYQNIFESQYKKEASHVN